MKEFLMLIRENANYGAVSFDEMHADIQNYGCLGRLYAKNKQLNKAYEYYNLCMNHSKNKADRNFIEQKLNALKEQIFET